MQFPTATHGATSANQNVTIFVPPEPPLFSSQATQQRSEILVGSEQAFQINTSLRPLMTRDIRYQLLKQIQFTRMLALLTSSCFSTVITRWSIKSLWGKRRGLKEQRGHFYSWRKQTTFPKGSIETLCERRHVVPFHCLHIRPCSLERTRLPHTGQQEIRWETSFPTNT